jgi:simple sugar transport system permease protein
MTVGNEDSPAASVRPVSSPAYRYVNALRKVLHWRETGILLAVLALFVYFRFSSPYFLTQDNLGVIGQYVAAAAIIAAGEVMVLICGELDLSVGQVYAMAPFIMYFAQHAGIGLLPAVVLGLVAAALVGLINGVITVGLGIPSFVTTLGMLFFLNGFNLTISGGYPVQPQGSGMLAMVFGAQGGAIEILWAIGIAVAFQFLLMKTRWGLHTVATGGNPVGAAEVGIQTGLIKIGNFMLCSTLGGLAGVLDAFRIGSIDPLAGGTQIMFMAIASAVIGGTLLTGGSGTVVGALLGAVALGVLKDGFTILGVNAYTFDMILGIAIVVTMFMNVRLNRIREKGGKS